MLRRLLLVLTLLAAACGSRRAPPGASPPPPATPQNPAPPASFPVTVVDDVGRQVTLRQAPQRIVSVAPSNTEILFALGLGDRVVGVTTFCDYPAAARTRPQIGGLRPNLEVIVALAPDLVLGIRGTPPDVIAALEAQQVPVLILNPVDFPGVLANIRAVGRLSGAAPAADGLATSMETRWNDVVQRSRGTTRRPRVLYEIDATDPAAVSAAGPGTFIDAMIVAAGGVNVLAALTPGQQYPRISAEAILQTDPDLIILGDAPFGQSLETVARRPGWGDLAAVRSGAVVGIPDFDITSRAGPRLVEGLEVVARAIQPDLFGAPAPR